MAADLMVWHLHGPNWIAQKTVEGRPECLAVVAPIQAVFTCRITQLSGQKQGLRRLGLPEACSFLFGNLYIAAILVGDPRHTI